ncbi:hypothetical protein CVM73_02255 [Bradyrhizobium forestalis]|uniref:Uncharacterized protein n=1 Tax=Bradyrhizobium forestalis TaxID=1419263 RepID=A0A2M8RHD6_9BRAD|nr:hypothetical protein CVM73_02255 [Bradyrhizobium forestalis]
MPRLDRGIQYAAASPYPTEVSGILDRPPSRAMTPVWVATARHKPPRSYAPHPHLARTLLLFRTI